jgi:ABC-2 type transport system permease protein
MDISKNYLLNLNKSSRMKALIFRILKQLKNDPRTLAIMLVAPLLLMSLIYFLLSDNDYNARIGVYDIQESFIEVLSEEVEVKQLSDTSEINSFLKKDSVDAVLWADGDGIHTMVLENNSKSAKAMQAVQRALSEMMPMGEFTTDSIYGSTDESYFSSMAYIFLTVVAFFFTFIVSGMALVRERFTNTLERLLMSPIRRWQIVGGYIGGYGTAAVIQGVLIILTSIYVLSVPVAGSVWLCILIIVLLSVCAVETGALVSIFANSEFQVAQFIPILVIPQIFFTGIIPIDIIPYRLGNLCYIMPMYYGATPLKEIMVKGAGFVDVLPWLLGLVVFIVILFIVNTLSLKKYRKL